jgi:hypothetical protein
MSQTHAVAIPSRSRIYWLAPLVLVTLVVALVTLALMQDGGGDQVADTSPAGPTGTIHYGGFNPATGRPHSAPLPQDSRPTLSTVRPDESGVAAAIGGSHDSAQDVARPDESGVAAAIGRGYQSAHDVARPDGSGVAAAIGRGYQSAQDVARPDESVVAAAVGGDRR